MRKNIDFKKKTKKHGITGVARLKNADEFLEIVINSYLEVYDEILLIDSGSTDSTKEICARLAKLHDTKVKFLEYPYEVYGTGDSRYNSTAYNEHSLAYYYNWCFSNATYSYVTKLDDDVLLIDKEGYKLILQKILNQSTQYSHFIFPQLNIYRELDELYIQTGVSNSCLPSFPGLYLDHGIYFSNAGAFYAPARECEIFLSSCIPIVCEGIYFVHLKGLKNEGGYHNMGEELRKKYLKTKKLGIPLNKNAPQIASILNKIGITDGFNSPYNI